MDFVVLIHVLAGATWFGGHMYVEALMGSAARTGDSETIMTVGVRAAKLNGQLFGAAGTIALLTGAWIVVSNDAYEFESLFVAIGLALTLGSLIFGFAVLKPAEEKIDRLAAEKGFTDPETMDAMSRAASLGRAMTLAVTVIIILMVLKPGL